MAAVAVVRDGLSVSEAASDVTSQLVTGPWTAGSVEPRASIEDTATVTVPSLSDAVDVSPARVVTSTDAAPTSADSAGHPEAELFCQALESVSSDVSPCSLLTQPVVVGVSSFDLTVDTTVAFVLSSFWVTEMVERPCGWAVSLSVTALSLLESNDVIDSRALPSSGVDAYVWPGLDIGAVFNVSAVASFPCFDVDISSSSCTDVLLETEVLVCSTLLSRSKGSLLLFNDPDDSKLTVLGSRLKYSFPILVWNAVRSAVLDKLRMLEVS